MVMKSIAIDTVALDQWKSKFINTLNAPGAFNFTFTGLNPSEINKIVQEIPTEKEEFIGQLFKLPEEVMLPIFENLLNYFSYSKKSKEFIAELADQLFKLQPDVLHPLITTHGAKLIKESGLNEKVFIDKLFELPEDTLHNIINTQAVKLCKASDLRAGGFTDKLFALDTNILYPLILTEGHKLLKASHDKSPLIEKLFALPPEVLHPSRPRG